MQVVHTRCIGPQYSVILKKMLRCVDHLPLTPNDIHTASSAHGSFGDVLHQLCKHTDLEVQHPYPVSHIICIMSMIRLRYSGTLLRSPDSTQCSWVMSGKEGLCLDDPGGKGL